MPEQTAQQSTTTTVLDAVRELHEMGQVAARETVADRTGLKLSIVDDRRGLPQPKPVVVGDVARARLVYVGGQAGGRVQISGGGRAVSVHAALAASGAVPAGDVAVAA